jgi:predicted MFS family arabinose efflux permease
VLHRARRAYVRLTYALFIALGAQVGAFAVLVPGLAATRGLRPGALGAALAVASAASIVTLLAAGRIADRVGPRPLALGGVGLFALAFAGLALITDSLAVAPTLAVYGVAAGLLDLAANATGAHVERLYALRAMVSFHAGFSAAACVTALAVSVALALGAAVGAVYAGIAATYALAAVALGSAAFPAPRGHAATDKRPASPRGLLTTPGVAVAVAICTICFFGDGALESFAALVLREALGAGILLAGLAVAAFHAASLAGRILLARLAPRTAIVAGGLGAAAGTLLVVLAPAPAVGAAGLLVVGFALAPVIPTAISLAARAAPRGSSGAAVSLVTSVGYSAFVAGPPVVGALAEATTLRAALAPVVASTLAIAVIGSFQVSSRFWSTGRALGYVAAGDSRWRPCGARRRR